MKFDQICKQLFTEEEEDFKNNPHFDDSIANPDDPAFDTEPLPKPSPDAPTGSTGLTEYHNKLVKFAKTLTDLDFNKEENEKTDESSSLLALTLKLNNHPTYAGIGSLSKEVTRLSSSCVALANSLGEILSRAGSFK